MLPSPLGSAPYTTGSALRSYQPSLQTRSSESTTVTFLNIPPTTFSKMSEFIHLGTNRVDVVISQFRSPATTVVLLPSFRSAISTTASGRIGKVGVAPVGQISVRVGPGQRARTAILSPATSLANPSAKVRAWAFDA